MSATSSKYAGLPDIDQSGVEVYETPDTVGDFGYEHDSDSDTELPLPGTGPQAGTDENISVDRLDAVAARARFKDARLKGDADFASTLAPRKRRPRPLYPAAPSLPDTTRYEMIPRGYTTDNGEPVASTSETPIQRLRRLRFEMEEVEGQLEASKAEQAADPTSSEVPKAKHEIPTGALLAQLRYLRNDLTRLNGMAETLEADGAAGLGRTDELLQRIASPTPSSALPALPSPSPASAPSTSASAADLDDRLLRLERFVGASEADVDESHPMPPSLVSSLSKLEHQLQLLTQPRHLDTVARRVKTLVGDLERVHEARRKLGDTRPLNVALGSGITVVSDTAGPSPDGQTAGDLPPDALQKIDALSALLPRLEPLLPLAPALLARLRTLAPLHGAAADFGASLAEVRREAATVREAEGGLREALEGLERSFDANERTVKGNLEALEGRMKALGPRLEALGVAA